MDIYEQNIDSIIKYIKKGCKSCHSDAVGVEIEHFVCDSDGKCVPYKNGVEVIMNNLSSHFDNHVFSEGFLIGLSCENYHITLEPGSQIEISIKPTSDISEISHIYNSFLSAVNPLLCGQKLVCSGYMPMQKAEDISLIPKKRYEYMDKYFKTTGLCGKNMMRSTASTQVSIDFADETDCINKIKFANKICPILALICDNSPVFDGKPFAGNTLRSYIWSNVDSDRCGIFDCNSFKEYAEYIYNSPAILVSDNSNVIFTGGKKICDIYKDRPLTETEIEHLLSMFFPDVRLKQYIEIRPADSMPIRFVLAYAALIKGLFNGQYDIFLDVTPLDIKNAKNEIILHGFYGNVYGMQAYEAAELLYQKAYGNLSEQDRQFLQPMKEIIFGKKPLKETIRFA